MYSGLFAEAASRTEYMKEYMKNRYHSTRDKIVEMLGGKCSMCDSTNGPWHFDHKDKSKKTMRASDLHSVNDKRFKKEVKGLQLLCADCHKKKTRESWDYSTPKPKHGTYWFYRKYNCDCSECTEAYKKKQKEWRENRKKMDNL